MHSTACCWTTHPPSAIFLVGNKCFNTSRRQKVQETTFSESNSWSHNICILCRSRYIFHSFRYFAFVLHKAFRILSVCSTTPHGLCLVHDIVARSSSWFYLVSQSSFVKDCGLHHRQSPAFEELHRKKNRMKSFHSRRWKETETVLQWCIER